MIQGPQTDVISYKRVETCLNPKSLPLSFLLQPSDRAATSSRVGIQRRRRPARWLPNPAPREAWPACAAAVAPPPLGCCGRRCSSRAGARVPRAARWGRRARPPLVRPGLRLGAAAAGSALPHARAPHRALRAACAGGCARGTATQDGRRVGSTRGSCAPAWAAWSASAAPGRRLIARCGVGPARERRPPLDAPRARR